MQVLVVVGGIKEVSNTYSDATYTFKTGDSAWTDATSSNGQNPKSPLGSFEYNSAITVSNVIYLVGK